LRTNVRSSDVLRATLLRATVLWTMLHGRASHHGTRCHTVRDEKSDLATTGL